MKTLYLCVIKLSFIKDSLLNSNKSWRNPVIGIDVGGTNTVVAIVDKRGQILNSGSIKTAKHAEVEDYLMN